MDEFPVRQEVVVLQAESPRPDPEHCEAAWLLVLPENHISAEALSRAIRAVPIPGGSTFSESRRHFNWGADLGLLQDIFIGVGSSLSATLIVEIVRAIMKNSIQRDRPEEPKVEERESPVASADEAWPHFKHFIRRAFQANEPVLKSLSESDDGWWLEAKEAQSEVTYSGRMSRDSRIVSAVRNEAP